MTETNQPSALPQPNVPNTANTANTATATASAEGGWACSSCGAQVQYAAGTSALSCPYCGHRQDIAAVPRQVREHALAELGRLPAAPTAAVPEGVRTFSCPGCRAVTESDALSDLCQFCATPLVADASLTERVAPEAVVPFTLDRDAARDALRAWTSSRWFAPSSLKKVGEAETFTGTYLPHWTYDTDTVSDYRGKRGDHYYDTETYTEIVDGQPQTKTREVQRTRWRSASGTVQRFFDDVLVNGTTTVPEKQLDKLTPWPLEQAVPYQEEYLAGFRTLRYDVEPEDGLEIAKERMAGPIEADCRDDIGGDEQRLDRVETRYFDTTFKLLLLPVWFLTYLHAGKPMQVMVNAGTGKVIGKRPYSVGKILAAVAAGLALAAAVTLVVLSRTHQ